MSGRISTNTRHTPISSLSAQNRIWILLVEDEALFAKAVSKRLRKAGFRCEIAPSVSAAREHLAAARPDLILLDMRLPDGSGLDFLTQLRRNTHNRDIPVIVLTAFGEVDDAVAAMKQQALDYLCKPIDLDELLALLQKILVPVLTPAADSGEVQMLGNSAQLQAVRSQIQRIARLAGHNVRSPPTVLLLGETGVGKDFAARLLHYHSERCERPFIHVDCAALPKDLIEAELFGHEKGAFTGAHGERVGLLQEAGDGTVFLDEIGELPLELQTKLLAVLERRTLRRIGSSREQAVPAWFIAATNRDLQTMVSAGRFRADLYYRLKVLTLELPPLRDRGTDSVLLAKHFATQAAARYGLPEPVFQPAAASAILSYAWPGNVRELANVIERAVLLGGEKITTDALGLGESEARTEKTEISAMTLENAEATLIRQALEQSGGNVSEAARRLGITRMTLRYRMQKYEIDLKR